MKSSGAVAYKTCIKFPPVSSREGIAFCRHFPNKYLEVNLRHPIVGSVEANYLKCQKILVNCLQSQKELREG